MISLIQIAGVEVRYLYVVLTSVTDRTFCYYFITSVIIYHHREVFGINMGLSN